MNNLFADPTPEELEATKHLAAPAAAPASQAPSALGTDLQDAALGAAQGATFGLADELAAAGVTAKDVATGKSDLDWKDIVKHYYENKAPIEKSFKEAQERSPWLYGAGQMGGGILTAPLGGALLSGGKTALGLGKAAMTAEEALAAANAAKNASTLAKVGTAVGKDVVGGIVPGAIIGAADSGAHLNDNAMGVAGDAGKGALTGGLLAGGIGLAAHGIPAAYKGAKGIVSDYFEKNGPENGKLAQLKKAYDLGEQGVNLNKESAVTALDQGADKQQQGLTDKITGMMTKLGEDTRTSLDNATKAGKVVNLSDELQGGMGDFIKKANENQLFADDKNSAAVFNKLFTSGENLNPNETKTFLNNLDSLQAKLGRSENLNDQTLSKQVTDLQNQIKAKLKFAVPEYDKAALRYARAADLVPESLMSKLPPEYSDLVMNKLKNREGQLYSSIKDISDNLRRPTALGKDARLKEQSLKDSFGKFQTQDPEAAQQMGAGDFFQKMRDIADTKGMTSQTVKQTNEAGSGGLWDTIKHSVLNPASVPSANTAGRVVGRAENAITDISNKAYKMNDQQIQGVAKSLQSIPGLKPIGDSLLNSQATRNEASKNAAIFSLLQNPLGRAALHASGISEEPTPPTKE